MKPKRVLTVCLLLALAFISTCHGENAESSVASPESSREERVYPGTVASFVAIKQPVVYPTTPVVYPVQPTYPVKPVQPTYPVKPVQPTYPAPTKYPVKPVQPTYPTPPKYPVKPVQPTYPAKAVQPTYPVKPVQPTYPAPPKYPEKLTYPVPPVVTPRECQTPFSQSGCPFGQVCTADYRCEPLKPVGSPCRSEFECLSGRCLGNVCVQDECQGEGYISGCPAGQECVQTRSGRVCRPRDDSCRPAMSAGNCPSGSYCGQQGRCTPLLDVNAPCWNEVQCLHHVCRGNVCKMDACPQLNSDQDCPAGQFCSSSQRGNICVNRRADGEACSSDAQCQSYRCDGRRCRRDTCRTLLSRDGCPDGHICQQGQHGNLCVPLLARGASCSSDRSCLSDSCRAGRCYEDLCPTPLDTAGCDFSLLCVHTLIGNECMTKLTIGADCTADLQCLSNFCDNNQCRRPLAKNGDSCRFDNDCFSRNCFKGICRPSLVSNGGSCQFDDECFSGNCFRETCRPQGTGTEICQTNRDCLNGICINGICSTPGTGTEVCRFNSDCLNGNCINGICTPSLVPNGERCQLNDDCVSRNCFNGICRPPGTGGGGGDKRPGQPCVSNSECSSGRCVAGTCGIPLLDIGQDCATAEATPANELCRSNRCDASTMLCARGVLETGAVCTDEQQCAGTCPPLEGLCVGDLIPQN